MNVVHKKDYKNERGDKLSQVDNVNRAGYVPLDIQYESMRLAGIRLDNIRDYQYSYDLQSFVASGKTISEYTSDTLLKSRFNDKQELDDMIKSKLDKYATFKSNQEKLEDLKRQYDEEMKLKQIKEEAIRNYMREQEERAKGV